MTIMVMITVVMMTTTNRGYSVHKRGKLRELGGGFWVPSQGSKSSSQLHSLRFRVGSGFEF